MSSIPDCIILGTNLWDKCGVKAVYCAIEAKQEDVSEDQEMKHLSREQQRHLEQAIHNFPDSGRWKPRMHTISQCLQLVPTLDRRFLTYGSSTNEFYIRKDQVLLESDRRRSVPHAC